MSLSGVKRQTVLLSLIEKMKVNGSWCGETHIQKCGYFCKNYFLFRLDSNIFYINMVLFLLT